MSEKQGAVSSVCSVSGMTTSFSIELRVAGAEPDAVEAAGWLRGGRSQVLANALIVAAVIARVFSSAGCMRASLELFCFGKVFGEPPDPIGSASEFRLHWRNWND